MDIVTQQNKNDKLKLGNITIDETKNKYGLNYGNGVSKGYIYVQLELLYDFRISPGAKELFMVLWAKAKPPNSTYHFTTDGYLKWYAQKKKEISQNDNAKGMSKSTLSKYMQELIAAGYLGMIFLGYTKDKPPKKRYRYVLHEIPTSLAEAQAAVLANKIDADKPLDIEF